MTRTPISVVLALVALAAAMLVAPVALAAGPKTPPVALHAVTLPDGLRVGAAAGGRAAGASPAEAIDTGSHFTMLGVVCAMPDTDGAVDVHLRISSDGDSWSDWFVVPLEVAQREGQAPRAYTEAVWTGSGRYVQVRATGAGDAPAVLRRVRVVALDPEVETLPTAAASLTAAVLSASAKQATSSGRVTGARPAIVSRKGWGADESWRGARPEYAKVKMIFVHHTDSRNEYTQAEAPAIMRAIYAYHAKTLGWGDIGYNFLIDRFGTIYEGHYGGVTRGVVGAQVLGFNRGSCGISVIGDFSADATPAEVLASLEKLIAWKLKLHHLKAGGTARIRCTYGQKFSTGQIVTFPVVAGHRDANFTECPGNVFYPLLPSVRLEAAGRPQPPIITLVRGQPSHFSPNGDGTQEEAKVSVWLTKAASWNVELRDARGERIGSFSGEGASSEVDWAGKDQQGDALPDGTYRAVVTASTDLGEAEAKTVKLVLDTVAPLAASVDTEAGWFSPNGDGWADTARLTYQAAEKCATRVSILGQGGKVERRLTDWREASAAEQTASWTGGIGSGDALSPAPDGDYEFLVESRDAAGNLSRAKAAVVVDRTVGDPAATPGTFSPNGDGVQDSVALGFTLTRPATVKVTVKVAGKGVRTMQLGELPAGAGSALWDGLTGDGAPVASGDLTFAVSATSARGTSSVSGKLALDLERPVLGTPAVLTGSAGKNVKSTCTVQDAFGDDVKLSYSVSDAGGAVLASGTKGWVKTGTTAGWSWKPPAAGVYTITWTGVDRGGNREQAPAVTQLTVQ